MILFISRKTLVNQLQATNIAYTIYM